MTSLTRTTLNGLFWMFLGAGAQGVTQLLVLVVLARLVSPAEFGIVAAAMVIVNFSSMFAQLGVGTAVVQRPDLQSRHLRTAFSLSLLFSALLLAMVWIASPYIAEFFRMEGLTAVLRALSIVFLLQGTSLVSESLLQRNLAFRSLAGIEAASYTAGFGAIGITLGLLEFGVWSLVGAQLAQTLLKTSALLFFQRPPKAFGLDRSSLTELLYFSGGFTIGRIANYLAGQGDNLVVGRWLGPEALGLYTRAYHLMTVPALLFGQVLDKVLFPAMAKVQSQPHKLRTAYRRGVAMIALGVLPLSAVLFVLAPELIHVLFGPAWTEVITPFQVFCLAMLFRTSYKMSDSLARATGAVYQRAWRQAIYAAGVIGGAWLGQRWGLFGVAVGVLAAIIINFLLMAHMSLTQAALTWREYLEAHVPGIALAILLGSGVWLIADTARILNLAASSVLAASAIYTLVTASFAFRLFPRAFLGPDGIWLSQTLSSYITGRVKAFNGSLWVKN